MGACSGWNMSHWNMRLMGVCNAIRDWQIARWEISLFPKMFLWVCTHTQDEAVKQGGTTTWLE